MIQHFKTIVPVDGHNIEFRFQPMNILKLCLFQVYVNFEGKERRFHMHREQDQEPFVFAVHEIVPAPYRELERVLSDAIFIHCGD